MERNGPFRCFGKHFENRKKSWVIFFFVMCILTHSHTVTPFDASGKQAFENTVGKGEIARDEQFLLFPQCFLPVWITFFHFLQI